MRLADVYHPITIGTVGKIDDTLEDEKTRSRLNGKKSLVFSVFRQSGANSVKVADELVAILQIPKDPKSCRAMLLAKLNIRRDEPAEVPS